MRWTRNDLSQRAAESGLSVVPQCGNGAVWYKFIDALYGEIFAARGMECAIAFMKGYQAGKNNKEVS
jgi:hypothetical protein